MWQAVSLAKPSLDLLSLLLIVLRDRKKGKKAAFVRHMGAFIVEEKRMIDLLAAQFERAFFFFSWNGGGGDREGEGLRGAERGPRTFTQRARRGLNRRDDHRVRPPTVR